MKGKAERRNHTDVTPGMTFYHARDPNPCKWTGFEESDEPPIGAHMVITKRYVKKMDGGYWEYLLLGPGPTLMWDTIQWIVRIADPKFCVSQTWFEVKQ